MVFVMVSSEWPPPSCADPLRFSGANGKVMELTDYRTRNLNSECVLDDVFGPLTYIKFRRVFSGREIHPKTQSTISFDFIFDGSPKFQIELNNDRLRIVDLDVQNMLRKPMECSASLASNNPDWTSWMRIRMNNLYEIKRTFVSVDLAEFESSIFLPCVRFEMDLIPIKFNLRVNAKTDSGMVQAIHDITTTRPSLIPPQTPLNSRMDKLERSIVQLQDTLHNYMQEHDKHVSKTKKQTVDIRRRVTSAKNRLEDRYSQHLILTAFALLLAGILICCFVSFKFQRAKRFHLL